MTFSPVPIGCTVEDATTSLLADGVGDGLPVVPPTVERWERMLDGVADPDAVLAVVPPLFGELTARTVAGCCVLAGCRPGVVPLVLAAARAACEPEFNLLGVQTTTGTAAVGMIVHGPVVSRLGLSSSTGMLGPGPHANGVLGRALALTLSAVGGVTAGVTSMATTAQPARYGFCLAESGGASAVTVLAIGGTAEVLPRDDLPAPDDVLDPLADALAAPGRAAGGLDRMAECEQTLVLPPEIAGRVRDTDDLLARAHARLGAPVGALRVVEAGGPGVKMLHLPGWMGGSRGVTRTLG
ncbi:hypothetical protein [Actinomycetospora termitidis]|uniref:Uncharacterized protein n=1 Tax=Actinomycetospora termitidis TaxID=3053470 RepID=A0ABT7MEJ6_9PSEU|nr:hypothetical protein [Actinomycetospora sp. Odt1-22]MDL5159084.1 hypothetical protein [Actinomycetospora sp. Odt1-22]